jgi:hypothetical protein
MAHDPSGPSADERPGLEEQIQTRAYTIWLAGGCRHGNDLGDWLQAERDVLEHSALTASLQGAEEKGRP